MELRPRTRQHVMRVLLAALLDSDLSAQELRELATNLRENSEFLDDLAGVLRLILHRLERNVPGSGRASGLLPAETKLFTAVQRRRLPKRILVEMMEVTSPSTRGRLPPDMTVRELIEQYVAIAKSAEVEELRTKLEGSPKEDPYLEGILRRRPGLS